MKTSRPDVSSLSLLLLASALLAVAADPPYAIGLRSIRAADLRADLTFLASDALEGRRSLQPGSEVAIQFLMAELTRAGLQPVLQTVPLIEYRTDARETILTLERGGTRRTYRYQADFFGGGSNEVSVRAPVVFAGYGITAPEFDYDDYTGLDPRGKIVLVFDHEPQEDDAASIFNGRGNTRYAASHLKLLNAQRHGAVALLVVAEPNRKHPSAQDRMKRVAGGEERMRRLPPQALAESEIRIPLITVSDSLAADLLSATGKTPAQLQTSIDRELRPAPAVLADTTLDLRIVLEERRRGNSANVLAVVKGSDPRLKSETIIFSSHYDHDGKWDGRIRPGADDNGSGTVGVLELARAFALNPVRPRRTLVFASFAGEERGLLGSYYYAAHPLRPLETTRAVINFDMIGRHEAPSAQTEGLMQIAADTSRELNLIGTINSPDYRQVVERENRSIGLVISDKWDRDAALNIFQRSDQFPFAIHGIPAVWWFTGFHPDYHQATDTVEKIDFEKMERIVRLAYLAGWVFANEDRPPAFLARPRIKP